MLISSTLFVDLINVEVSPEDIVHPIKVFLKDQTIHLKKKEALELGSKLEQAYIELNLQGEKKANV
jgi:hypothetical protein